MARRFFRFLLSGGLLLAVAVMVRRTLQLRHEATDVVPSRDSWTPIPEPGTQSATEPEAPAATEPEAPAATEPEAPAATEPEAELAPPAWLPPVEGACPPTHQIKAKAASHIYHLPGMLNYDRTKPDRCYADEVAAEADGFTKAKR
jgi:hypothetical protein